MLYGKVDPDDELRAPTLATMGVDGDGDVAHWRRFTTEVQMAGAGNYGYTVRVVPSHPDLLTHAHLARVAWAPSPTTDA